MRYIKGDLFTTNALIILHGCNAQGVMGSGVAKIVREKYPESYKFYVESKKDLKLGDIYVWHEKGKTIVHGITQEFYGRDSTKYVSYDAIDEVMKRVEETFPNQVVAMPQIGAGLGGGNWPVIEAIICHRAKTFKPWVYSL